MTDLSRETLEALVERVQAALLSERAEMGLEPDAAAVEALAELERRLSPGFILPKRMGAIVARPERIAPFLNPPGGREASNTGDGPK